MDHSRRVLIAVSFLATLSGCASLSKSECEVGDWYTLGKTDGYNGQPSISRIASYNEACNKHGIVVDQMQYNQGHSEGLLNYCTFSRGISEGRAGRSYAGLCQGQADAEFRRGHSVGREYYEITSKISSLRSKISYAHAEQKKHKPDSAQYYKLDGDIRVYNTEINNLSMQQGQVQQRIDTLMSEQPYSPVQ